jgi:glycolate oxidase iron-sulfur subunit
MAIDKRDLQKCIHCGLCLQACPTYVATGEEAESPRGRIYLMRSALEGRTPWSAIRPHIDACMGCLGCQTACPSGVPYARLIEGARAEVERHARSPFQRWVRQQAIAHFTNPVQLRRLLRLARGVGFRRAPRWLARMLGAPESAVALPEPPRTLWRPQACYPAAHGETRGRVGLLLGCAQWALFPEVHRASIRLLTLAGFEVHVPPNQGCCGALWVHNGYPDHARRLARRLFQAFEGLDFVVVNAAGCGSTMKEYGELFAGTAEASQAQAFSQRVRDITELLAEAPLPEPQFPAPFRVAYHDACHLLHGQGIRDAPRQLLKRIPQLELVELEGSEMCCGSAGIYNLLQPALAKQALARKVEAIRKSGADALASPNPGCTLWIAQGLREAGNPIPIHHPMELLAKAYPDSP